MSKTILSIDCGTQSLRALLFSLEGELLAIEKIPFEPYISPQPGWAEQDANVYWNALKKACSLLNKNANSHFNKIAGIGIASIRNSMICLDRDGNPLRSSIVWLDQRKAKPVYKPGIVMRLIIRFIGMTDAIRKAQSDGKCNWIKQNQPEIWRSTYKYMQVSGFLNFKLTGSFKESTAAQIGHIPFDYKKQKWGNPKSPLVFSAKIFRVEEEKLPELVLPGELIGKITDVASRETGIKKGVPVVACGSDKGCGTIGSGVLLEEKASLSFGTTAVIQTVSKKYREPVKYMPSYPAVVPHLFNPEVEIFRGFWMIKWFKEQFANKEIEEARKLGVEVEEHLNELLRNTPAGNYGLLAQPFWGPGLKQPSAKGALIGFGGVHEKQHVYRAIIEGICFALREGKEKIEKASGTSIKSLAVFGGASKSNEICQIAADVFNLPVIRSTTTESSGLGAAIITAIYLGEFDSYSEAIEKMVHSEKKFIPEKVNAALYDKLFTQVYKKMYKKLSPLYQRIRSITGYPE